MFPSLFSDTGLRLPALVRINSQIIHLGDDELGDADDAMTVDQSLYPPEHRNGPSNTSSSQPTPGSSQGGRSAGSGGDAGHPPVSGEPLSRAVTPSLAKNPYPIWSTQHRSFQRNALKSFVQSQHSSKPVNPPQSTPVSRPQQTVPTQSRQPQPTHSQPGRPTQSQPAGRASSRSAEDADSDEKEKDPIRLQYLVCAHSVRCFIE